MPDEKPPLENGEVSIQKFEGLPVFQVRRICQKEGQYVDHQGVS